jgi:hypothetical protein
LTIGVVAPAVWHVRGNAGKARALWPDRGSKG